jgi:hypothetical protein
VPPPLRVNRDLALRDRVAAVIVRALDGPAGLAALRRFDPPGDVPAMERVAMRERLRRGLDVAIGASDAQLAARAPLERALAQAALLFRAGLFFEVHEVLEAAWRELVGGPRVAVQGLIQIAVGFHHLAHDNPRGAVSLFASGRTNLESDASAPLGVAVETLLAGLRAWEAAAAAGAWNDTLGLPSF